MTKFAQSTTPKGRGRKGSQCPRKRKMQISTENIVTNPILAQSHVDPPTSTNPVSITVHTAPTAPVTQISNVSMPSVSQTNFQVPSYSPSPWFPPLYAICHDSSTDVTKHSSSKPIHFVEDHWEHKCLCWLPK